MNKNWVLVLVGILSLSARYAQAYVHTYINETEWNAIISAIYVGYAPFCNDDKNNWLAPKGEKGDRWAPGVGICCLDHVDLEMVTWTDAARKNTQRHRAESYSPPHTMTKNCTNITMYIKERKNAKGEPEWYIQGESERNELLHNINEANAVIIENMD